LDGVFGGLGGIGGEQQNGGGFAGCFFVFHEHFSDGDADAEGSEEASALIDADQDQGFGVMEFEFGVAQRTGDEAGGIGAVTGEDGDEYGAAAGIAHGVEGSGGGKDHFGRFVFESVLEFGD
jgi:hypothetical protein